MNVESKGRGVTIEQVAKYKSEGKKTIYVLRDEGNINQGKLFKIDQGFDSNINNARGEVFFMTRQEYNNFLRTGQIGEAFASFLSSRLGYQ